MRQFEEFNWDNLEPGKLVLMTVENLESPENKMRIADFKDTRALYIQKFNKWVGMSPTNGPRFGSNPLKMINGVWFCIDDPDSQKNNPDFSDFSLMSLEMIR
jgi:hypothetical protein